jgi:hypothetical protein
MRLPEASPVWQHAATLEPQACWWIHTNGDAQAVGTDEVLAAVAAGELLAVAASSAVRLGVDVNVSVSIRRACNVLVLRL